MRAIYTEDIEKFMMSGAPPFVKVNILVAVTGRIFSASIFGPSYSNIFGSIF